MHILIIEDNRFVMLNHQMMADCLCREGAIPNLSFAFAGNYFEAIQRLKADKPSNGENRIHAIISDFKFPLNALDQHGGGIAFFRAVVAKYEQEKRQHPPFFYLSHRTDTEIRAELNVAGLTKHPSGFFDKSIDTLFTIVDHIRAKFPLESYKPSSGYNVLNSVIAPTNG